MRMSTVFSVLACGAMALAAVMAPDVLAKRDTDISVIIGDLNDKCDSILPLFDTCYDADCTESLVGEVVAAVEFATNECVGAVGVLDDVLAGVIAEVVIKISVKLNDHKSSCNGKCGDLSVYEIDVCIAALLSRLVICISRIIATVVNPLGPVVGILEGLSLTLILQVRLIV